jgi:glyoxylase-like metal-dependent hydrolase (beta-lactamase superfamily II)
VSALPEDAEASLPLPEQVRPGLWSVRVPWPGGALGYTLVYVLAYRDGLALIDAGWPTDLGWSALADGIRRTGHDLTDIRYVLVTHFHADHLGLAGRVRGVSGAWVGMHPAERAMLGSAGDQPWRRRLGEWMRLRGAPSGEADEILSLMAESAGRHALLARPDVDIEDGDRPLGRGTAVRAVWTPGHSPGHLCFYDEERDLLLTGDHVLPRITPHIGLPPGVAGDPLGDYLASLRALLRYDPAEVLPAHEHRFTGLGARIEEMLRHHRARLAEIEQAVVRDPGVSTWAVAEALTWSRGWEQTRGPVRHAAVSETWAHLVHLRARARVIDRGDGRDRWWPGPRRSTAD